MNLKNILLSFHNSGVIACPFLLCLCLHKEQKWQEEVNKFGFGKQRYFVCHPDTESSIWDTKLDHFKINPVISTHKSIWDITDDHNMTMEEQFNIMSSIPNYHKWDWGKNINGIKFAQKFSNCTRYHPASPRNRIVEACCHRNDSFNIVKGCLQRLRGVDVSVHYQTQSAKRKKGLCLKEIIGVGEEVLNEIEVDIQEIVTNTEEQEDFVVTEAVNSFVEIVTNTEEQEDCVVTEAVNSFVEIVTNTEEQKDCVVTEAVNYFVESIQVIDSQKYSDTAETSVISHEILTDKQTDAMDDDVDQGEEDVQMVTSIPELLPAPSKTVPIYTYYCTQLFGSKGKLMWRHIDDTTQVVLMNDYDCNKGDFLGFDYIHVMGSVTNDIVSANCQCKVFTTVLQPMTNIPLMGGSTNCCHTRLFKEIYLMLKNDESSSFHPNINAQKVKKGLSYSNTPIVELNAKDGVKRFSINADGDVQMVTIFKIHRTDRLVIKCHSSYCKMKESNTRSVKSLRSEDNLCPHLKLYKHLIADTRVENSSDEEIVPSVEENSLPFEKWCDVFDESTGLWSFGKNVPSSQLVDSDSQSSVLKDNVRKRNKAIYAEDSIMCFQPCIPSECCECGGGWLSDEYPEGVVDFLERNNLYTSTCAVQCKVYFRSCVEGSCRIFWTGENDSIFRFSHSTCAGYEIAN